MRHLPFLCANIVRGSGASPENSCTAQPNGALQRGFWHHGPRKRVATVLTLADMPQGFSVRLVAAGHSWQVPGSAIAGRVRREGLADAGRNDGMKVPDFVYARALTFDDAFRLKAQHGADARWLAGGQSLLASLAFRLSEPSALIDISDIQSLQGITQSGGVLRIGAGTTHAALGAAELVRTHAPLIADAIPEIAHVAIRNRGTIGGSLAFADPAAELPACCVALDATLVLASASGERRVPARDFFHGVYATALADDELLAAIEVPIRQPGEAHALVEITRRAGDYAMAGLAAAVVTQAGTQASTQASTVVKDARLVFFALGDRPVVAVNAAAALVGLPLDETQVDRAAQALTRDLDPPGDLNGAPSTKRHLAQVVLRRALAKLMSEQARSAA